MNANEILGTLGMVADLVGTAQSVYARIRTTAEQNGVTDDQLRAADARFMRYYPDPLAADQHPVGGLPPNPADVTAQRFTSQDDAIKAAGTTYNVIRYPDGHYGLWPQVGPFPGEVVWRP